MRQNDVEFSLSLPKTISVGPKSSPDRNEANSDFTTSEMDFWLTLVDKLRNKMVSEGTRPIMVSIPSKRRMAESSLLELQRKQVSRRLKLYWLHCGFR